MRDFCADFFRAVFDILKESRQKSHEKKMRKKIHLVTARGYARGLIPFLWTLFFASSIFLIFFFLKATEEDKLQLELIEKQSRQKKDAALLTYSEQSREEVVKRIWLQQDKRLEGIISSVRSTLFLFPNGGKFDVVEEMEEATCLIQQDLFFEKGDLAQPMQEISYLEAEKANHNYTSNLLVAQNVKIYKVHMKGHDLPVAIDKEKIIMEARADKVTLSLSNGKIKMQASQLKAELNDSFNRL